MPLALIPLAVAAFGIGLTEFIIAGLLPDIAGDFAVDAPTAGWLISGYALSVAVGALGITAMTMRFTRNFWCSGYRPIKVIAVVQFGFAMMP